MKTLAQQVDELECRALWLEGLAGDMLATVKLNLQRGYLVVQNDGGKLNLERIITSWEKRLGQLANIKENHDA